MTRRRVALFKRPPQGWSSLLLFLGMLVIVGVSISDARPLEVGGQVRTGSLVVVMLTAGLIGFVLARSSIGIVRSHVLGAAAGAMVLLMIVGAAAQSAGNVLPGSPEELTHRLQQLGGLLEADIEQWIEVPDFVPMTAVLLVLGAISWTTGQFGAFSIFRYDRGGPAVMATGVLLFLNVATRALRPEGDLLPLIPVLAAYSALAMLLLMRMQLGQQSEHWARRHIADAGEVGRLFLRTGTLFVAVAVVGASSLTALAVAAPPQVDLDDLDGPLEDLSDNVSRFLTLFAVPGDRSQPTTFGSDFEVLDEWEPGHGIAFTAIVEGGMRDNYWWGAAYDHFDGETWSQSDLSDHPAPSGSPLGLSGSATIGAGVTLEARISPDESFLALGTVLGAAQPQSVGRDVTARTIGEAGSLGDITFDDELEVGDEYRVVSFAHDYQARSQTLTANALRAAGTDYPPEILDRYLGIDPGSAGSLVGQKADDIVAAAAPNAYDRALMLQNELREFDYVVVINGCGGRTVAECLLHNQRGFCQQFATTMVMVLRTMGIPARFVNGFLPGASEGDRHTVDMQALHSWVEVYFPDHGWVRFDPTPVANADALNQAPTGFEDGPEIEPPDFEGTPDSSFTPLPTPEPTEEPGDGAAAGLEDDVTASGGGTAGGIVVFGGLVALALLALAAYVIHRLRRLPGADAALAYRGIVSLATRLGYGPHPSQTEYEYASSLSETLPGVRDDLYLVAGARVESAYGHRLPAADRLAALRRAYARIRTALLRLTLRRRG